MSTDLENASTQALVTGKEHVRLSRLTGEWKGVARLWLDPEKAPEETPFLGHASLAGGGLFLRLAYVSTANGKPATGELTLAFEKDEGRWAAVWIDTFHTGSTFLVSYGPPQPGAIVVQGSYFTSGSPARWGWRTEIDDTHGVVIRMFNVSPGGEKSLGVEIVLARAAEKEGKKTLRAGSRGKVKK